MLDRSASSAKPAPGAGFGRKLDRSTPKKLFLERDLFP